MAEALSIQKQLEEIVPDVKFSSRRGREYNYIAWCDHDRAKDVIKRIESSFKKTFIGGAINLDKRQLLIAVYA